MPVSRIYILELTMFNLNLLLLLVPAAPTRNFTGATPPH